MSFVSHKSQKVTKKLFKKKARPVYTRKYNIVCSLWLKSTLQHNFSDFARAFRILCQQKVKGRRYIDLHTIQYAE